MATDTQDKVNSTKNDVKEGAQESGKKLGAQTKEAFDQFSEHDNPIKGYEAFWEKLPTNYYFIGSAVSIALSALLFLSGKSRAAIFVGLWPTTIINLALMAKRLKPSQEV